MNPLYIARLAFKSFNFIAPKVQKAIDDYKANAREADRLFLARDYAEAARYYAQTLKEAERRRYTAASKTNILLQLTECLRRTKDFENALPSAQMTVACAKELGTNNPLYSAALDTISRVHEDRGEIQQALLTAREALSAASAPKGDAKARADRAGRLAKLERAAGDPVEWRKVTEQAIEFYKAGYGMAHPETAAQLAMLGTALQESGQLDEALTLFEQAYEIHRDRLGATASECLQHMEHMGQIQYLLRNLDEALRIYTHLARLKENEIGVLPAMHARFLIDTATVHQAAGEAGKAAEFLMQAKAKVARDPQLTGTIDQRLAALRAG